MRLLKIEEVQPGLKVAKDVSDPSGILLFKAGVLLTEELIKRIKDRMVTHVYVEDEGAVGGLTEDDIARRHLQIDLELDKVFSNVINNSVMLALCESAKKYLKSHIR